MGSATITVNLPEFPEHPIHVEVLNKNEVSSFDVLEQLISWATDTNNQAVLRKIEEFSLHDAPVVNEN